MSIRRQLLGGLLAIVAVMSIPFVYSLLQLYSLQRTTRSLQENEFTASLLTGRVRETAELLRRMEIRLSFGPDTGLAADSLGLLYTRLRGITDSLASRVPVAAEAMATTTSGLQSYIAEYTSHVRNRQGDFAAVSDSIFSNHLLPAIRRIESELPRVERALDSTTAVRLRAVAEAAEGARTAGIVALAIAVVLALGIGLWVTTLIARPVRELERAMATVAAGDFSYPLATPGGTAAEFARLARSYRSMARQLAELDKLKAEFVSVASHELKTPINVITGYLQLLDEGVYGDMNARQREICRLLETQSQSLGRLVHQLLDVSRFEAGGGRLETTAIDVARFLSDLEDAFRVLAIQKGVSFVVERGPGVPQNVQWDEDRMSEVVGNILSNAFKFTPDGGKVTLRVYNASGRVTMEVEDTGAGIPAENVPRVFEKFFQASNQASAANKGTGLGLAIAREIVEAHDGSITVRSTEGAGTTFTISLPERAESGRALAGRRRTPPFVEGGGG